MWLDIVLLHCFIVNYIIVCKWEIFRHLPVLTSLVLNPSRSCAIQASKPQKLWLLHCCVHGTFSIIIFIIDWQIFDFSFFWALRTTFIVIFNLHFHAKHKIFMPCQYTARTVVLLSFYYPFCQYAVYFIDLFVVWHENGAIHVQCMNISTTVYNIHADQQWDFPISIHLFCRVFCRFSFDLRIFRHPLTVCIYGLFSSFIRWLFFFEGI